MLSPRRPSLSNTQPRLQRCASGSSTEPPSQLGHQGRRSVSASFFNGTLWVQSSQLNFQLQWFEVRRSVWNWQLEWLRGLARSLDAQANMLECESRGRECKRRYIHSWRPHSCRGFQPLFSQTQSGE
ncbi:hypothetical protein GN956_G6780 [Arapaima gigas]